MSSKFKPTHIPFDAGIERIHDALSKVGHKLGSRILTSRDREAVKLCNLLAVDVGAKGFVKWQLPFFLGGGQFFITVAQPGASVGDHSHDNDGVRLIMSGSIYYDGIELNSGDWMYVPQGKKYSFTVGPHGAIMGYCYQCCCGGRELSRSRVINPEPYVRVRNSLNR